MAAPASSRGAATNAAAGLSGGYRGPQVRSVATAQAKRRVELPIRRRRRLERTEGLDRRKGGRQGRDWDLGEAPSGPNHARAAHKRSGMSTAERTADGFLHSVT